MAIANHTFNVFHFRRHLDPSAAEVKYNPKYEELFAPEIGPVNPFKTQQQAAKKNRQTSDFYRYKFEIVKKWYKMSDSFIVPNTPLDNFK